MSRNGKQDTGRRVRWNPLPPEYRIPDKVLDLAVIKSRRERTYAIDRYKTSDWEYVRTLCGHRYGTIPLDDVRHQAINRRKAGAYKEIDGVGGSGQASYRNILSRYPDWYRDVYLKCVHWLTYRQRRLDYYGGHCSLCYSTENVEVHHNHYTDEAGYSILFREKDRDSVVLCRKCHRRHHKYMNPPPEIPPRDIRVGLSVSEYER
jgi:5-methylcytosine-specific restriction endonuclease McrA